MYKGSEEAIQLANELSLLHEIIEHTGQSGKSSSDAAQILGVEVKNILNMLILKNKRSEESVGLILRGDEKLDNRKLKTLLQTKHYRFATQSEINEITGFQIGGIPPVSVAHCKTRYISERVMECDFMYGSGGTEYCAMKISPKQLEKIPGVEIVDAANLS